MDGSVSPVSARARLETWLRTQAPDLVGPVLDVATPKAQRRWLHPERLTLDMTPRSGPDIVGDLEALVGIEDARFGSIVCTEVLEHVRRPDLALSELRRVCRPGGLLLLSVPWFYPFHPCPLDLRRFTLQGISEAVVGAGWELISAEGLPLDPEVHALIVEAVRRMNEGRCPRPESLGFSNWVVRARVPPAVA